MEKELKSVLTKTKKLVNITKKILDDKKARKENQAANINSEVWLDKATNLMWQVDINNKKYTWEKAFDYVERLNEENYGGYNDWRVPTLEELMSLGNVKLENYLDDSEKKYKDYDDWKGKNWEKGYDNGKSYSGKTFIKQPLLASMSIKFQTFWSSVSDEYYNEYAWVVYFGNGGIYSYNKSGSYCIRCVR
jgi:uncharacterized protein (TIGR02145 family)